MRLILACLVPVLTFVTAVWSSSTGVAAIGPPGVTPVPCGQQAWQPIDPTFEALPGARAFSGHHEGAVYRIEIPERWNGDLVLYAHGFRGTGGANGSRLAAGFPSTLREVFIARGFAWAASSYRCNGYVPGIGLQDTMALRALFTRANGGTPPQRVYLTGTSMGGHVTLLGMQEFPTEFAGALAMCPASPELFDFFLATAAAAEVVTGQRFTSLAMLSQDLARITERLGTPAALMPAGRQLASVQIGISGGPRPFAVEGLATRFLQNISGGALAGASNPSSRAASNAHVGYRLDERLALDAGSLNAAVRRKPADPALRAPGGPFEELVPFDGRFNRPVLTMHGTGDLFVPIGLQQQLKRAAQAAGREDRLVQRIYRIGGHCQFSAQEEARAFDDLVRWVRDGVRPAGDEVMGDLRDAGRTFTVPLRPGDPGTRDISPGP